ncbi:MAG: TasA family protein [Acidimicrobiales bacterium]
MGLATVAVAGGIAAIGAGAFATFNATVAGGPQAINSGTMKIDLGATGASTNRLTVNATNIAPGDTIDRSVDLSNDSTNNMPFSAVTLSTSFSPSSLLNTSSTMGLQLTVSECSVPWTEAGTSPAFTYTCSGTTTSLLGPAPWAMTATSLGALNVLSGSNTAVDHLLFHLVLPSTADNTLQGQSSTVTYTFTATQRAASAH